MNGLRRYGVLKKRKNYWLFWATGVPRNEAVNRSLPGPSAPRHLLVGGRAVVTEGQLAITTPTEIDDLLRRHREVARRLQAC